LSLASAGTLLGDASGAVLDDMSWARLLPWRDAVQHLDRELAPDLSNLVTLLRPIPLAVWGQLLLRPNGLLGRADALLPVMPTSHVQQAWTGLSDGLLLRQSVAFIERILASAATLGVRVPDAQVLDFGVGWGRISSLAMKFWPITNIVGCDAWSTSLDLARACRLPITLIESDPLLRVLPVPDSSQDLVFAASVFTSLSEEAFEHCLNGLSRVLRTGGGIVFTVRPPEYWALRRELPTALRDAETADFYFHPYPEQPHYGDASVSQAFLTSACARAGLADLALEWLPSDPHQVFVSARRAT
jgi:SAM-dependent methyltransferase